MDDVERAIRDFHAGRLQGILAAMKIPSAPAPDVPPSQDAAMEAMVQALRDAGERFRQRDGWVILDAGLSITTPLVSDLSHDGIRSIQLIVPSAVSLGKQQNMFPVAVGEGATFAGAVAEAASVWISTALPMFRAAMANTAESPAGGGFQVDIVPAGQMKLMRIPSTTSVDRYVLDRTSAEGRADGRWNVFCAVAAVQGEPAMRDALSPHLSHLPPLAVLLRRLHGSLLAGAIQSLQLIVVRRADRLMVLTCLLNGEPWQDGKDALHEAYDEPYPWPGDQAIGFRQYVVLRPVAGAAG